MLKNILISVPRNNITKVQSLFLSPKYLNKDIEKNYIVQTNSGVVLCWHPEQKIPYEHSLPIQKVAADFPSPISEGVRQRNPLRSFVGKGPTNKELQEIFYTNKNEWYTRTREEKLYQTSARIPKRK
uniref:39S ribosomal protein L41, mitochondrial n=1 Tax=Parastrongyloides trichosuri TaxID=131310 RepID=A0A0N5A1Y0_PARTI